MSGKSQASSLTLHILAILWLLIWSLHPRTLTIPEETTVHLIAPNLSHGPAGGGGAHEAEPARKGVLPRRSERVFTPPMTRVDFVPKLAVTPTMEAPPLLQMVSGDPGLPNGIGSISGGTGGALGIGDGHGPTVGNGTGTHYGEGIDGVFSAGHGVSSPVPIHMPEPEYSDAARRARLSGSVLVAADIGADGRPHNLHVLRGLGLGLDEKALEAVSRWLFRPGMKDGHAVTVRANIMVNFHLL